MYLIKYKIRSICSRGFGGRAERRDSRTLTDGVGLDGADNRGCFTRVGDGAALKYDRSRGACYALVKLYLHPGFDNCNLDCIHYCGSTSKVTTGQQRERERPVKGQRERGRERIGFIRLVATRRKGGARCHWQGVSNLKMRASVIADAILLFGLHFLYWCCNTIDASGGALDSSPNFQSGSSGSSHSKVSAFSATLTDGLAQAVAHEAGKLLSDTYAELSFCINMACFPLIAVLLAVLFSVSLIFHLVLRTHVNIYRQYSHACL